MEHSVALSILGVIALVIDSSQYGNYFWLGGGSIFQDCHCLAGTQDAGQPVQHSLYNNTGPGHLGNVSKEKWY